MINVITAEVTNVSLMFREVQGGSFHFCTVPKDENSGFSKQGNEIGLLFGKRPRFEFSFFRVVQKTKTATLDFSLVQLTLAMD